MLSESTGNAIVNATGMISSADPRTPSLALPFGANPQGQFQIALPLGNYSVSARAWGFLANNTPGPVFHSWVNSTQVWLNLTPLYGANLSVQLLNGITGAPIPGGNVTVGVTLNQTTNIAGWAFFVDVLPAGEYAVVGNAVGYIGNSTTVYLALMGHPRPIFLNLTPLPGCPPTAQCAGVKGTAPGSPFTLLPSSGVTLGLLYALPLIFLVAVVAYALGRRRGEPAAPSSVPARLP